MPIRATKEQTIYVLNFNNKTMQNHRTSLNNFSSGMSEEKDEI